MYLHFWEYQLSSGTPCRLCKFSLIWYKTIQNWTLQQVEVPTYILPSLQNWTWPCLDRLTNSAMSCNRLGVNRFVDNALIWFRIKLIGLQSLKMLIGWMPNVQSIKIILFCNIEVSQYKIVTIYLALNLHYKCIYKYLKCLSKCSPNLYISTGWPKVC